jgi:hypothetical protein
VSNWLGFICITFELYHKLLTKEAALISLFLFFLVVQLLNLTMKSKNYIVAFLDFEIQDLSSFLNYFMSLCIIILFSE